MNIIKHRILHIFELGISFRVLRFCDFSRQKTQLLWKLKKFLSNLRAECGCKRYSFGRASSCEKFQSALILMVPRIHFGF